MAANLEKLFDVRRQLVAWASHDLRTPLASMQAMLEALEDGLVEPEQYLLVASRAGAHPVAIVDDLFELARIDAGVLTLELAEAQLDPLVEACLRGLEPEARARHITLDADVNGSPPVLCAPEKVERVLYNLLANALRHTPTDGSVAVRVRLLAHEVCVTVEDTGAGFQAGTRERLGPRARDRTRLHRAPGRPDLAREPPRRRREHLVHASRRSLRSLLSGA